MIGTIQSIKGARAVVNTASGSINCLLKGGVGRPAIGSEVTIDGRFITAVSTRAPRNGNPSGA